jgi:hypothetical protein
MVDVFYQPLLAFSPLRESDVLVFLMNTSVVPKASPDALPELASSLAPFAPLFRRSTSRENVERYLPGLLTALERTNCDTIAACSLSYPASGSFSLQRSSPSQAPHPRHTSAMLPCLLLHRLSSLCLAVLGLAARRSYPFGRQRRARGRR